MKKKVVIIGAGPAGLTSAYELLNKSKDYDVTILESDKICGGLSKTIDYKGNKMDIGGHRFFSQSRQVNLWWNNILPYKDDNVMLKKDRHSSILFENKFFDYPITLKRDTFKNLGFITSCKIIFSYLKSCIFKRRESNLENFYINRFGKRLYKMFFENYTEKLWGIHPKKLSSKWGSQRVKGLSIRKVIKDALCRLFHIKEKKKETSLITSFMYPKYGSGQMWSAIADKISLADGKIIYGAKAHKFMMDNNHITSVIYQKDGKNVKIDADIVISSMSIKDLICSLKAPKNIKNIANNLIYRDYIIISLYLKKINIKDVKDNWIYINNSDVDMCRIQLWNNWSKYLVKDGGFWVGVEYFCNYNDDMWKKSDKDFLSKVKKEMIYLGFIDKDDVIDYHIKRVQKAYPTYYGMYDKIDDVKKYIDSIDNLYSIGRNGQHNYNNMDHSMISAFKAVDIILNSKNKSDIWNVNIDKSYNEK